MAPSPDDRSQDYSFATLCATVYDPEHKDQYGSSSQPIYQCTTFKGLPGSANKASSEFDYSRSGNPTRTVLQNHMSKLQGCKHTFAVSTGMACLDVVARRVRPNEVIIAGTDVYGGTERWLSNMAKTAGVQVVNVDQTDLVLFEETVRKIVEDGKRPGGAKLGMVSRETAL